MKTLAKEGLGVLVVAVVLLAAVRISGNDNYGITVLPIIGAALAFAIRHVWSHFRPPQPPVAQPETRYTKP